MSDYVELVSDYGGEYNPYELVEVPLYTGHVLSYLRRKSPKWLSPGALWFWFVYD